jgi:hypothetical protein
MIHQIDRGGPADSPSGFPNRLDVLSVKAPDVGAVGIFLETRNRDVRRSVEIEEENIVGGAKPVVNGYHGETPISPELLEARHPDIEVIAMLRDPDATRVELVDAVEPADIAPGDAGA